MSTDPTTGITNPAMGLLKFQRAKELKIPWANALTHMHIIKGKVGIDINICQAILTRPGSGLRWTYIEEYTPLFKYMDKNGVQYTEETLPPNAVKCDAFSDALSKGKIAVILAPTLIPDPLDATKVVVIYQPYDYRTIIEFTRKKKDIDGTWFETTDRGVFSWQDAITAKLPFTSGTNVIDQNSNWAKRPKFMIYKSAFWDGANRIANDLLLGSYDIDDLNSIQD